MCFFDKVKKFTAFGVAFVALNTSVVSAATLGQVVGSNVNIRSASSTDASVVSKANAGDNISIIASSGDWFKIASSSGEAYITSQFVKITQADGTVNSSNVNLRTAPSTTSSAITQLSSGTVLPIIGASGDWYETTYNGTKGYIYKDFVSGDMLNHVPNISPQSSSSSASSKGEEIVAYAKKFLGTPYVYGGTNLNSGVDCSGFIYAVYKNFGITLSRSSREQIKNGTKVDKSSLQAGDLVFFNTGGNSQISHVGMYMGNGQYIHSTDGKGQGVTITSLNSSYSLNTYVGACRILK